MIAEIHPEELHRALTDEHKTVLLIDVREPEEVQISALEGSLLVPLMELEDRIEEVRKYLSQSADEQVVFCRGGARSELAIQWLQNQVGIKGLKNLVGGINAYAERSDNQLPTY